MSGGDTSVSTLHSLNDQYKKWVKGSNDSPSVIVSGSAGSCNASTYYGEDDGQRIKDYAVCDSEKCYQLSNQQWLDTYGNCRDSFSNTAPTADKTHQHFHFGVTSNTVSGIDPNLTDTEINKWETHYDPCFNMVEHDTLKIDGFDLGGWSDESNTYDPVTDTLSGVGDDWTGDGNGNFDSHGRNVGRLGNYDGTKGPYLKYGIRVAYPFAKGGSRNEVDDLVQDSAIFASNVASCDSKLTRTFKCDLDGSTDSSTPGCGNAKDGKEDSTVQFCARNEDHYTKENIAKCCLGHGTTANGPEVDSKGAKLNDEFDNCPMDYCVTRRVIGSGDTTTCETPATVKDASDNDETVCYEMSDKCDTFFTDVCDAEAFNDTSSSNKMNSYCRDWAHIQPSSFKTIAREVCNIDPNNKFTTDEDITEDDLRNVKNVLDTSLCREYIVENMAVEGQKLNNLCAKHVKKNDDDSWEVKSVSDGGVLLDQKDYLSEICGCFYPQDYYTWWRSTQNNQSGVCKDSSGSVDTTVRTSEACSAKGDGYTWETDVGETNLVASIDSAMQSRPECYFQPCTRSLLYNVASSPCQMNLQLCYQYYTENNTIVAPNGKITRMPSDSDDPVQSCSQQNLLQRPSPTPSPGGDGDGTVAGFFAGIFGGGDDGDAGGGGDDSGSSSTTIIIIIVVLLIIIVGVVAVVMMNKGDPNPPSKLTTTNP